MRFACTNSRCVNYFSYGVTIKEPVCPECGERARKADITGEPNWLLVILLVVAVLGALWWDAYVP